VKGLILAGGKGTRLYPLTKTVSKQLLPVFDKPMIYYPLSTLMLAGIREVAIISTPEQLPNFQALLGDGSRLGIALTFLVQSEPRGLADAYAVSSDFLDGSPSALILGDNLLYGVGLGKSLSSQERNQRGARIFGAQVRDPENYGVLKLDKDSQVSEIVEKPQNPEGNLAVPGLYFLDGSAPERVSSLIPSQRGELEISDLLNTYINDHSLTYEKLPRGTVWLDMGTPSGLAEASDFVRIIQTRQQTQIACVEEVALRMGFITLENLEDVILELPSGPYVDYLRTFVDGSTFSNKNGRF
jgi:glucose-1-phosphate thymidylyltransferase